MSVWIDRMLGAAGDLEDCILRASGYLEQLHLILGAAGYHQEPQSSMWSDWLLSGALGKHSEHLETVRRIWTPFRASAECYGYNPGSGRSDLTSAGVSCGGAGELVASCIPDEPAFLSYSISLLFPIPSGAYETGAMTCILHGTRDPRFPRPRTTEIWSDKLFG